MKKLTLTLFILVCISPLTSWARGHGHHHGGGYYSFGFYSGYPYYGYPFYRSPFYSPFYDYPYYSPAPVIAVPPPPPTTYIEQSRPNSQEYPEGYWYYCSEPQGYYPYVKDCHQEWQQIEPNSPSH